MKDTSPFVVQPAVNSSFIIPHPSFLEKSFDPAAVNDDGLARDVRRALGGEEGDRGGDLFGARHPTHRHLGGPSLDHLFLRLSEPRPALDGVTLLPRRQRPAPRDGGAWHSVPAHPVPQLPPPARPPRTPRLPQA